MATDAIDAVKIEMTGEVTSFRYPHFTQGYQPTYEMPPPSTIYGLICSAVGDYLRQDDLERVRFGYRFVHSGKFTDFKEHLHYSDPIQPFPFDRQLLFQPRLTLYITGVDLYEAFIKPRYCIVLGRSQDLVTCRSVQRIQLNKSDQGYFDHTLLPLWMAPRLDRNITVATMPRYINPSRYPTPVTYALLKDAALWPPSARVTDWIDDAEQPDDRRDFMLEGDENLIELWVDQDISHPRFPEIKRAVWLHSFVD